MDVNPETVCFPDSNDILDEDENLVAVNKNVTSINLQNMKQTIKHEESEDFVESYLFGYYILYKKGIRKCSKLLEFLLKWHVEFDHITLKFYIDKVQA